MKWIQNYAKPGLSDKDLQYPGSPPRGRSASVQEAQGTGAAKLKPRSPSGEQHQRDGDRGHHDQPLLMTGRDGHSHSRRRDKIQK
jgi:hypothetical protein